LPLSWRHYVYGAEYLARADAREDVRLAAAVRIASHATPNHFKMWVDRMRAGEA